MRGKKESLGSLNQTYWVVVQEEGVRCGNASAAPKLYKQKCRAEVAAGWFGGTVKQVYLSETPPEPPRKPTPLSDPGSFTYKRGWTYED